MLISIKMLSNAATKPLNYNHLDIEKFKKVLCNIKFNYAILFSIIGVGNVKFNQDNLWWNSKPRCWPPSTSENTILEVR